MESSYQNVQPENTVNSNRTFFLRQLHISSGVWTLYFMAGLCTGAPTVFIPQIRREANSTEVITDELASWLYSTSNFTAIPWVFVLPTLSQFIGKKRVYLASCSAMAMNYFMLYFSSSPYQILIAEAVQGFVNGSNISVIFLIIPEYCSPEYRGVFLNVKSACFFWGIWAANVIGTFFYWKNVAILGLMCCAYSVTVVCFPESPHWLAVRGKFSECETAHRWLRGTNEESERELREIVKSQLKHQAKIRQGIKRRQNWSKLTQTLSNKQFYMPLLLSILVIAQYNLSGKFVCSLYAIDVIKKITGDEDAAYSGMLVLDGVTVFGMYVGSFMSKIVKTRTLYINLSFASIALLLVLSLYMYLIKIAVIVENTVVSLFLLVVHSLAISCGPTIISLTIYSEIVPVRYQAVSYMITSFMFLTLCTAMLKFAPMTFQELGMHGTFLLYAITSGIATVLLYIYLPETKNKTLLEIEEYFKSNDCKSAEDCELSIELRNKRVSEVMGIS